MYLMIPVVVIVLFISFVLGRKAQDRMVSDLSPFSFAEDMLIINTKAGFSAHRSSIAYIELKYNPKTLENRFYDMKIRIVNIDESQKTFRYRGSGSGAMPQDMVDALTAHHIKCITKEQ